MLTSWAFTYGYIFSALLAGLSYTTINKVNGEENFKGLLNGEYWGFRGE